MGDTQVDTAGEDGDGLADGSHAHEGGQPENAHHVGQRQVGGGVELCQEQHQRQEQVHGVRGEVFLQQRNGLCGLQHIHLPPYLFL